MNKNIEYDIILLKDAQLRERTGKRGGREWGCTNELIIYYLQDNVKTYLSSDSYIIGSCHQYEFIVLPIYSML